MNKMKAWLCLFAVFSTSAYGEVYNIERDLGIPGWTATPQFIGTVDPIEGIVGYPISQGDTVNMDFDFAEIDFDPGTGEVTFTPATLKLTATAGDSAIGFMLDRPGGDFSVWTIANVTVTLKGYATDGTGSGFLSAASQTFSGGGLGPYFQQSALGVADGQYIEFSGFQASFDVVSLDPPSDEFTETLGIVNNWTVETIANPPIAADVDIVGQTAPDVLHPHHDGTTLTNGTLPDDIIRVRVFGASTLVGDPEDLDTDLIDSATLQFGPGMGGIDPGLTQEYNQDFDSDGLDDAQFRFRMSAAAFDKVACTDSSGTLTGDLTTGGAFEGSDTFTSNCNAACH